MRPPLRLQCERPLSAAVGQCETHADTKRARKIRKGHPETDNRVNRAKAFSGTREKSRGKGRKWTHQLDPIRSLRLDVENGIVRKWLALLGIMRGEVHRERGPLALTNRRRSFA